MDKANPPGKGEPSLHLAVVTALERYVAISEDESLVRLFDAAPMTEVTDPAGQTIRWMFACCRIGLRPGQHEDEIQTAAVKHFKKGTRPQ